MSEQPENPAESTAKAPPKNPVRDAIMEGVTSAPSGKSIDPVGVAKAVSEKNWSRVLKDVRAEAIRLHKAGEIAILRKGKPVEDPDTFKGVWRLSLPPQSP